MKWFAPILSFTTEEIYRLLFKNNKSGELLIKLKEFIKLDQNQKKKKWKELIKIRDICNISIEEKRREGLIGSSLEAEIDLEVPTNYFKILSNLNLSEIFICSKVEFKVSNNLENDEIIVNCKKVSGLKCERCWKISDDVKIDSSLCPRCTNVIDTLR